MWLLLLFFSRALGKASRARRPHKTHRLIPPPLWDAQPVGRPAEGVAEELGGSASTGRPTKRAGRRGAGAGRPRPGRVRAVRRRPDEDVVEVGEERVA